MRVIGLTPRALHVLGEPGVKCRVHAPREDLRLLAEFLWIGLFALALKVIRAAGIGEPREVTRPIELEDEEDNLLLLCFPPIRGTVTSTTRALEVTAARARSPA